MAAISNISNDRQRCLSQQLGHMLVYWFMDSSLQARGRGSDQLTMLSATWDKEALMLSSRVLGADVVARMIPHASERRR